MQIPDWAWPAIGALIAVLGLFYGRRKDRDEQLKSQAILNTNVGMLITKTDTIDRNLTTALGGIDARLGDICRKQDDHTERIAKVEESTKSAHRRINEIKKMEE